MDRSFRTRFAPSPTGLLHLGHAFSVFTAFEMAKKAGGHMLLRIEDIDLTRARPEFENAILEDLAWLEINWPDDVRRQSDHFDDYRSVIEILDKQGLVYPCFCTRKEIAAEIEKSANAPHGPEGYLYPGICKSLSRAEIASKKAAGEPFALRLNNQQAIQLVKSNQEWPLIWRDMENRDYEANPEILGDSVLARKDTPTSYHLAVVHDDHLQGITHIIRGQDLFHATHIHRLLQALLGYEAPIYHHHELITDEDGRRLAKRDKDKTIRSLRDSGVTASDLRKSLGF